MADRDRPSVNRRVAAYLDEMAFRYNNRRNPYLSRDTLMKLINLPEKAHVRLWGSPVYYRAFSHVNGGPKTESDLFAGLR